MNNILTQNIHFKNEKICAHFDLPLQRHLHYNDCMSKCFKCGRYLGAKEEHMKMKTEKGKICYVCYNKYKSEQRQMSSDDKDPKSHKTKT
jgi:hypothetical protein